MIDGRVGDLGEALTQVGRQRPSPAGERRDRGVVPHGIDRIVSRLRERAQHRGQVLARIAVQHLARIERLLRWGHGIADGGSNRARRDPLAVRTAPRELLSDLAVQEQAALRIEGQDPAGPETEAAHMRALRQRHGSRLGCGRDEAVVGHGDPEGTEPVAVERRARDPSVAEAQCGRPVPRLADERPVPVEVANLRRETRVVLPGRRNEQRDGLGEVLPAVADEQLERVVQERRVRPVAIERRCKRGLGAKGALSRLEPADVAVDRVDLAVVAQQPERLGSLPARVGVRRKALVEDRERDGEGRILEVLVEPRELARRAQGLVGDGPERKRSDVDARHAFRAAPRSVRTPLGVVLARSEQELLDARKRGERSDAQRGGAYRNRAPAGRLEALGAARVLDRQPEPTLPEEAHREPGTGRARDRRREGQEDARTVARDAVRSPSSAVSDRRKPCQRPVEQLPRGATAHVRDEPDAAGIALASGVVEEALLVAHCVALSKG